MKKYHHFENPEEEKLLKEFVNRSVHNPSSYEEIGCMLSWTHKNSFKKYLSPIEETESDPDYPVDFGYTTDVAGYRNNENLDTFDFATFGCSISFGQGNPLEHTWPWLVAKEHNKTYMNFATPGGSVETVYDAFVATSRLKKYKKAIFNLPAYMRLQSIETAHYPSADFYGLSFNNILPSDPEFPPLMELLPEWFFYRSFKYVNAILDYAEQSNIDVAFTSWHNETYELLSSMPRVNLLPFYYIVSDIGSARDRSHPDILSAKNFVAESADQLKTFLNTED